MARHVQFKRLIFVTGTLMLALVGLGYRLVDLQVIRHGELAREAQSNTRYTCRLEPRRGDILDIKGNLLATSIFVKTICGDPSLIETNQALVAHALAPLLQMNEAELEKKLAMRISTNKKGESITNKYVVLKRQVSSDTWEKIQQQMAALDFGFDDKKLPKKQQVFYRNLRSKSIYTDPVDEQLRIYPNVSLASHVLGYVTTQENEDDHTRVSVGAEGIEQKLESKLRGTSGWRVTERDRQEREMVSLRAQDVAPQDGLNVVLTIDSVLQNILENALADGFKKHSPSNISGIIIRPRTGEILAMATLPNYDPNHYSAYSDWVRRNHVISDTDEPGSTFKIVVVSGALNDHLVTPTDVFNCEMDRWLYAGKYLHDHKPYGNLTVDEIISKSSNIGAAKIGILMHEQRLYEYIRSFGFGSTTGIPLNAESGGIVHHLTNWNKLSISRIPMGHEMTATPLQMAMAMCAVANKGVLMQPMLVDHLTDQSGATVLKYYPQPVRRVINEDAAREMVEALKNVVTKDGTAVAAGMTNYTVAGKTGTAQKPDHGTYSTDKFFSSFIGFFPADNPEICIYIGVDTPRSGHYGGDVAAPVFKAIAVPAATYLAIKPDRTNEVSLVVPNKPHAHEVPSRAALARLP